MNFYDDIGIYAGNTVVINENSEIITYEKIIKEADNLKENIKKRTLVFSICSNSIESLLGYIGFLRGKIVSLMINYDMKIELLKELLDLYRPEYIWIPEELEKEFDSCCDKVYKYGKYVLLKTSYIIDYILNDELAILLTTSGSTGSPKFVRQSYKNIVSNAESISKYLNITEKDRPITTLPMSYTYGLSIINSHLLKGASIILTNKTLMDKEFWALLKSNNATTFGGVPYIYEMLKKLRFAKMEIPSLKVLTQAGGKLSKELALEFTEICEKKGIRFFVMYGQTEATARMSYLPVEYSKTKAGSMGVAIPGGKFWLEDDDGNEIKGSNISGELIYSGENVTLGYAESRMDLGKGDENKGILRTGDVAMRDDDEFYYIVGRKKRFLKIYGNRVNLDELEQMIKSIGIECACTGEDDKLKVFITDEKTRKDVIEYIINKTGISNHAMSIYFIDKIPRSESGKILYSELK